MSLLTFISKNSFFLFNFGKDFHYAAHSVKKKKKKKKILDQVNQWTFKGFSSSGC